MTDRRTLLASTLAMGGSALLPRAANAASKPSPFAGFKLFDTHPHLHGLDLVNYPFRPDVLPDRKARALKYPVTPEYLLSEWDRVGVEMGCAVQYNTTYSTDNRYTLDMSEQHPQRISPVVILDPWDLATPATLKSMSRAYGIGGVRFSGLPEGDGSYAFFSDASLDSFAAAEELGIVVVLMPLGPDLPDHLPSGMKRLGEIAARFPKLQIVLDHFGFPAPRRDTTLGFSPHHLALARYPNISHKYTTFLLEKIEKGGASDREFLNYAVKVFGANRIVWGSDFGNTVGTFESHVRRAIDSAVDLPLEQRKAIFYSNAKRLFPMPAAKRKTMRYL